MATAPRAGNVLTNGRSPGAYIQVVEDASADNVLAPPPTKGHYSVVRLPEAWFVACTSRELKSKPLGRVVQGTPLVLFRGEGGKPSALLDRCPHRNVPLSRGCVKEGLLECPYHGWQFDTAGACRAIPGLVGSPEGKARRATAYPVTEQDGFIYVWSRAQEEQPPPPDRLPFMDDPRYSTVRRSYSVNASVHAVIENALDVPHTAFLHGGLFRTAKKKNEIEAVVRRFSDRAEAEYVGEPAPKGLVGRILAPGGGVVTHFDRFILPSTAQVEYRLGEKSHLIATSLVTPVGDFESILHAVVTFTLPVPHWAVQPFLTPVATHIFKQDSEILQLQTQTIRRFGGEQYASTEIDLLGPQILRLLLQAQRGEKPPRDAPPDEHRVRMRT